MLSRFIGSPSSTPKQRVDDAAALEDLRCRVRLRGSHGDRDLVVGTQADGALVVVDLDRERLPERAQAQLAFHEVASGRAVTLDVAQFFVFDLQVLELLLDAPGLNDAMYLYGALRGPYPAEHGASISTVEGQLTVTRSDLLAALVDGTADAFAYQPEAHGSRCVHALLPGEAAAIIDGGQGVILALPLAPAWTLESLVPNDRVAAQIFFDVLSALHKELGDQTALPVPSRAAFIHELEKDGWTIEGDAAVRTKRSGILGAILPDRERRPLPREGALDEYVAAATAALAKLGPPTPESLALRRRRGSAAPIAPVVRPAPAQPTVIPAREPRPRVEASPSDWMKDFVEAHRASGTATPRVSVPARAVSSTTPPSWLSDFEKSPTSSPDDDAAPAPRPDWSKDFE